MSLVFATILLFSSVNTSLAHEATQDGHRDVLPPTNSGSDPFEQRPFLLEAQVGIATPTGMVGAYVDYSVLPALSLAAGVGTNFIGPEAAAELRLRAAMKAGHALTLAGGYSLGPHEQTEVSRLGVFALLLGAMTQMGESEVPSAYRWELAHWVNGALGYERRNPTGASFRVFAGLGYLLNVADGKPSEPVNDPQKRTMDRVSMMAFSGVGFGYAR